SQRDAGPLAKIRVDLDPAQLQQMIELTGRRTVPQIFIGERHIGGYDDLAKLDRSGELKTLLGNQ
ncbi:glutaredoxin domain-containing protein, partial [Pseudomonas sihuiensis]